MPKTSLAQLLTLNPCTEGRSFAGVVLPPGEFGAGEARAAGVSFDDIVWGISALARKDPAIDAPLQRWLDACARHSYQMAGREYPVVQRESDERARRRDFEQGRLDAAVRAITRYAGRVAWAMASRAAGTAARAAVASTGLSGGQGRPAVSAAAEAAWNRAKEDAKRREEGWQFDRLVAVFDAPVSTVL